MKVSFAKYMDGLVPAIVQDAQTQKVLMLGFMNADALELTQTSGKVTFFSRSRQSLWVKGETSGNVLELVDILLDCDSDAILVKARPAGPVCHTGADTCFDEKNEPADFLFKLEETIKDRKANPSEDSYTSKLFAKGLNKIAQKVGEEAVELIIESKDSNDEFFCSEAADLLYHLLVLLVAKNIGLHDICEILRQRSEASA